ncbi:SRPBCC domain-containing protein [Haliscomenobacter sp.]|uniref:SRPBCC domain-containing protein n=1 Tax=Haliscomenobacter sp. TaxID=2717303 RepID=UPI003BAA00AF
MNNQNYSRTWLVADAPAIIFQKILDVRGWWSGLYSEKIEGSADKLGDEFDFLAGDGLHYSRQKLVELILNQKIVWLVTESKLSFIEKKDEWTGSKLCFEFAEKGNETEVRFTHEGLVPEIECYEACSNGWSAYLEKFLSPLVNVAI